MPRTGERAMAGKTRSRLEHRSVRCEHPNCTIKEFIERMVRIDSGKWYCPAHGLLVAAKELVRLYRAKGEADWTRISEIMGEILPERIARLERMVLWGTGWVLEQGERKW
jgi:hypothetical protein